MSIKLNVRKYLKCGLLIFALATSGLVSAEVEESQSKLEGEQAKVLVLADMHLAKAKSVLLEEAAKKSSVKIETFSSHYFKRSAEKNVCQYELVIFEAVNAPAATETFGPYIDNLKKCNQVKSTRVGFESLPILNKRVGKEHAERIAQYLSNGQRANYENLFAYISTHFLNSKKPYGDPIILPLNGFYQPSSDERVSDSLGAFNLGQSSKPVIAVTMHRSAIEAEQTQVIDSVIEAVTQQGAVALGVFYDHEFTQGQIDQLKGSVHAMINLRMLHEPNKTAEIFADINVPVIHGLQYRDGDEQSFIEANAGLSAMMSPYFLMLPEISGVIDPTVISTTDDASKTPVPLKSHINAIAERAVNQAQLSFKANKDKKLAMFMWNYPPGEKNIGAAFLGIPRSVENISQTLKDQGYNVTPATEEQLIEDVGKILKPLYRDEDIENLITEGKADYLPVADYRAWLATLPTYVYEAMIERWGEPENHKYVRTVKGELNFVIPRLDLGNLILLAQPSRSDDIDDHKAIYHSTNAPINHFYVAVYYYARKQFNADALLHLGTHGSQEWLPGKERGLSIYDAPDLAVGNKPVIYPYIMDNVGEAMQAKRRGRAVMVSHMTPGFAASGYYGDINELHEMLQQYMALSEGETKTRTQEMILEKVIDLDIFEDVSWTAAEAKNKFGEFFIELHDYMHEMAAESQPLGLHTFGETLKDAHIITTTLQILGEDFRHHAQEIETENNLELPQSLKDELYSKDMEENQVAQLYELAGFKTLWLSLIEKQDLNLNDEMQKEVERAEKLMGDFKGQQELPAFLNALNGRYSKVGYGGDPVRSPEAMPTGKNLVGFNPAKVPSKAAWETGKRMMEDTIRQHKEKHGEYPDKLAFSMWSLETMRHHGVLESQVMAALGVKPKWDKNGIIRGTEIIPFDELKRPRVDVVLSATGLYRDAFPNVMLLLAKAIKDVANLKEENNSIYKNTQSLKAMLLAEGKDETEAEYLSSVRIFSNETGAYGSGLADTSLASGTWEEDSKLSDLYLKRMGYAFGADEKRWSDKVDNFYGKVLSGTDAVMFSRSTNLYGMTTSDDPFQYFGGLSLAIRNLDGKSPEMMIANLRQVSNTKTETLKTFMAREMRTRAFHPRWIEEAQKEGYAGSLQMLDRINNFWGWTVMSPEAVTDAQWQEFADIYVKDKYNMDMREFFEQANPTNLAQMIERMLEAERKEYWQTDVETIKTLTETYLEVAREHDVYSDNEKFNEYLNAQAVGFGLDISNVPALDLVAAQSASQQVQGQELKQVEQTPADDSILWDRIAMLGLLLLAFIAGAGMQLRSGRISHAY